MDFRLRFRDFAAFAVLLIGFTVGGCATAPQADFASTERSASNPTERECLVRAMYFESNRASPDGLLAVGSVVMNRVASASYPNTICGAVGQNGQFASGVLTRTMNPWERDLADKVADEILSGKRHPKIAKAMYFHQAGLHFHYGNMHYVLVAGGNAFYEKF